MAYKDTLLGLNPKAYYRFEETTGTALTDETGTYTVSYPSDNYSLGAQGLSPDGGFSASFSSPTVGSDLSGITIGTGDTTLTFLIQTTYSAGYNYLSDITGNWFGIDTNGNFIFRDGNGAVRSANNANTIALNNGAIHQVIFRSHKLSWPFYNVNSIFIDGVEFVYPQSVGWYGRDIVSTAWFKTFTGTIDELAFFDPPLSSFQIQQLAGDYLGTPVSLNNYRNRVLSLAPYSYYRFNETSGVTFADETGNGNDITNPFSFMSLNVPGLITDTTNNSGLEIQAGSTEVLSIPLNTVAHNEMSFALWWKMTTAEAFRLFDNATIGFLDVSTTGAVSGDWGIAGFPNLALNETHFIVLTIDSFGYRKVYVDGQFIGQVAGFTPFSATAISTMSDSTNTGKGILDEVAVFPSVLSEVDIYELYLLGKGVSLNPIDYAGLIKYYLPDHYYRFGETTGATAIDEVGGVNLTIPSTATIGVPGLLLGDADTGIQFNNDGMDISTIGTPAMSTLTVAFLTSTTATSGRLLAENTSPTNFGAYKNVSLNSSGQIVTTDAAGPNTTGTTVINDGAVHHIVITYDMGVSSIKVWVDGVQEINTSNQYGTTISQTLLGYLFTGVLDEVAVWYKRLDDAVIKQLYAMSKNEKPYPALIKSYVPLLYYRLDETTGTTINDAMGNTNGTLVGTLSSVTGLVINDPSLALNLASTNSITTTSGQYFTSTNSYSIGFMINRTSAVDAHLFNIPTDAGTLIIAQIGTNQAGYGDLTIGGLGADTKYDFAMVDGTTYHILITYNGGGFGVAGSFTVFVDGKKIAQATSTALGTETVTNLLLFKQNSVANSGVNATVDEIFIINRVLTDKEIAGVYNASIALNKKFITGTIIENVAATLWDVCAYNLDNFKLSNHARQGNGDFSLDIDASNENSAHFITVLPVQGTPWKANTSIALGAFILPVNAELTPYYYTCTTSGVTGVSEPTWPTTSASTVTDGTVVWELVEKVVQPITHSPVIPF